MKLLYICGALAAGEKLASLYPCACPLYGVFLVAPALAALFSHALGIAFYRGLCVAVFGAGLYFAAVSPNAETIKLSPWSRQWKRSSPRVESGPVKGEISRRMGIGLDHCRETADINRAILLGERKALPQTLKKAFVEAGTIHIFAVSGLHVMVIAKTLVVLLMFFFVPQRLAGVFSLVPLWWYVHLIGASASSVRAAAMATIDLLAPLFWRKSDSLRSWSITFLAVHVTDPKMITDIGCNLSFTVMLSLILAAKAAKTFRAPLAEGLFFSVAAWAAGAPIAANVFGRVTPGGALANLALLPAAALSVSAGAIGVIASAFSDNLSSHFNNIAALSTDAMRGISKGISSIPYASFKTAAWHPAVCAAWYALLFSSLTCLSRKRSSAAGCL